MIKVTNDDDKETGNTVLRREEGTLGMGQRDREMVLLGGGRPRNEDMMKRLLDNLGVAKSADTDFPM